MKAWKWPEREADMLTPEELIERIAGDEAIRQISRHFDLTRDQIIAAIGALAPAFIAALQRNPAAATKAVKSPWEGDWRRAFSPDAISEGNAMLGTLFGSKEVSRALADHATRLVHINSETLQRLLPILAPVLMGNLQKPADSVPPIYANPFAAMFEGAYGATRTTGREERSQPDPFANLYQEFFKAMQFAPTQPSREAKPKSQDPLESTRKLQQEYFDGIERIFERFLPQAPKSANRE